MIELFEVVRIMQGWGNKKLVESLDVINLIILIFLKQFVYY